MASSLPSVSSDRLAVAGSSTISSLSSYKTGTTTGSISSSARPLTPAQAQMVLKAAKHWRRNHEERINLKISDMRNEKRSRNTKAENEVDELVARKVPFDLLTKEWLTNNNVSIGERTYILEKLIPTLVLGVEKLLTVAERKGLINTETQSKDFNPINYLAQFLMRNNPRYSNFAEASPYARGIRKLLDDLKREAFAQDENKLAKMKMEARERKMERERRERLNLMSVKGRPEALQELFLQWVEDKNGAIFLHLVQSALRSFQDTIQPQEQGNNERQYAREVGETDMTEKMIGMKEFVQLLEEHTNNFPEEIFLEFLKHMNQLAAEYRLSAEIEAVRIILANLFIACDHGETGLLDRKRVLKLLESFYDNTKDPEIKSSLQNPRQWPIIDIDEQEDIIHEISEEEELDDNAFEPAESAENDKKTTLVQEGSTEEFAAKEGRKVSSGSTDVAKESETVEKDEAIAEKDQEVEKDMASITDDIVDEAIKNDEPTDEATKDDGQVNDETTRDKEHTDEQSKNDGKADDALTKTDEITGETTKQDELGEKDQATEKDEEVEKDTATKNDFIADGETKNIEPADKVTRNDETAVDEATKRDEVTDAKQDGLVEKDQTIETDDTADEATKIDEPTDEMTKNDDKADGEATRKDEVTDETTKDNAKADDEATKDAKHSDEHMNNDGKTDDEAIKNDEPADEMMKNDGKANDELTNEDQVTNETTKDDGKTDDGAIKLNEPAAEMTTNKGKADDVTTEQNKLVEKDQTIENVEVGEKDEQTKIQEGESQVAKADEEKEVVPDKSRSGSLAPEDKPTSENGTVDPSKFATVEVSKKMSQEIRNIIRSASTVMDSPEYPAKTSRAHSVATGSMFDICTLNAAQFVNVLAKFLGELPSRPAMEALVRYVRAGYIETEEERLARLDKARLEAKSSKRRLQIDQLFDLWDLDGSGYLELSEIEMVLSKWREEGMAKFKEAADVFEDAYGKIGRKQFKRYIEEIGSMFSEENSFDSLIAFLFASVERSFEERKRGEFRKKWLDAIELSGQTSAGLLEPVFKTIFHALFKDAEINGRNKKISAYVAFVEENNPKKSGHPEKTCLRYVSCSPEDTQYVLDKTLYRDMKCVSFKVVDHGKPIHVPRIIHNGGVHLWNSARKQEGTEGSLVILPLKDHERQVTGILGVDTLPDPHERAVFVTHEISFYQGVAKALSSAIQFIDQRRKTIKIAESAVSWILRRSQNVKEVNMYLVEPGLKPKDGLVLRKMSTLRQDKNNTRYEDPPRLERKDNLFRDYLFKCIDVSETLTADAYGERHTAFPLRDADGMAVAIIDISIGEQRQLPVHENKEIHRMLKLLAMAHKEVSRESAGEEKNIVLKVEKDHKEKRIDVLFDRIMLQDLRENVGRLDARAFAEIKSYIEPPKIIHDIVKAVLEIHFGWKEDEDLSEKLEEWPTCKHLVTADLVNWISTFDPTAGKHIDLDGEKLARNLSHIPPGAVTKHGSVPAQYLFNWAFVSLSLIEHTSKMREGRPVGQSDTDISGDDNENILIELKKESK